MPRRGNSKLQSLVREMAKRQKKKEFQRAEKRIHREELRKDNVVFQYYNISTGRLVAYADPIG